MMPNTKISQTILEFGEEILAELPHDSPKVELEAAFRIILTAWNAVTLDSWNGNRDNEIALFRAYEDMPKQIQSKIRRLVARKKSILATICAAWAITGSERVTVNSFSAAIAGSPAGVVKHIGCHPLRHSL